MRTVFIHIKDISEIDTTKTTVYDLNKRFIDPHGRMYGLKYNRLSKKVEIVRLMRTAAKNANYFAQKMHENQRQNEDSPYENEYGEEDPDFLEKDLIKESHDSDDKNDFQLETEVKGSKEPEIEFETDIFINNTLKNINVHKERISGIIMNIDNAKIFNHDERSSSIKLENILRNLDIDGIQLIDKVISENKELLEYPRSLNFYIGRLNNKAHDIIANQKADSAKMRFIYLLETYNNFIKVYKNLDKFLSQLLVFTSDLDHDHLSKLFAAEKQFLEDANTSIENTLMEIHTVILELNKFKKYIYSANSFL